MRRRLTRVLIAASAMFILFSGVALGAQEPRADEPVVVASKPFGESYLLAELFAQLLESRGIAVTRRPGLGSTEIAFGALRTNAVDVYPEYTGTGLTAVLKDSMPAALRGDARATFAHVAQSFTERFGTRWLPPLGFQNTYAIAVTKATAARFQLRTLTDLARVGDSITAGFTADFIGRPDGLVGLRAVYNFNPKNVRPLAPAVKYEALAQGAVDVIDGYSTDGLLAKYDLVTLLDDKAFFPPYEAAALVSRRIAEGRPDVVAALALLSDRLDEAGMRKLNERVEVGQEDVRVVARDVLQQLALIDVTSPTGVASEVRDGQQGGLWSYLWSRRAETAVQARRHLLLVVLALGSAILVALPLGLLLERARWASAGVMGLLGVLQTIPSIALLAFMIPLFGVGVLPALVALWLYALFPIVRNTYTGVRDADQEAVEASEAMGATARQRLLWVRLPLAAPFILAGVRTAAVITVGAATLAAFIGAGGLGDPIVAGLALADRRLVVSGALPAAVLALLVDGGLALVERVVRPPHMRG